VAAILRVVFGVVLVCAAPGSRAQVSAGFRIHHRHRGSAHAVRWRLGLPTHSWLVVGRWPCRGARVRGSFPRARPPHRLCGCSPPPRLFNVVIVPRPETLFPSRCLVRRPLDGGGIAPPPNPLSRGEQSANLPHQTPAFCASKGLVMVPVSAKERPYVLGRNTASITLTFRAVSKEEAAKLKVTPQRAVER
jgi:hypothetical protein